MKDNLEMYKNYLYALRVREEYGNQYGDTDEIIKMYEDALGIKKPKSSPDNFEEVSTDIINAITSLHYEDREKEILKYKFAFVFCKMLQSQKEFDEDIKILDKHKRGER